MIVSEGTMKRWVLIPVAFCFGYMTTSGGCHVPIDESSSITKGEERKKVDEGGRPDRRRVVPEEELFKKWKREIEKIPPYRPHPPAPKEQEVRGKTRAFV